MIVCAGNSESFTFAQPIGIGLVNVAINLTKLCLLHPPEFILFVGTAGSYGKRKIFDIVESNTASNIEIGYFDKYSYTPLNNMMQNNNLNVSRETIEPIIVNSSNYITSNKAQSESFLRAGISIENMEFFSVLSVASEFNINVHGVFCVTNFCYEDAHHEFTQNHKKAMQLLSVYMEKNYKDLMGQ